MAAWMDGKVIPTRKLPDQLAILPKAIAIGLGATQNNSDPMKYGIGPKKKKWRFKIFYELLNFNLSKIKF